MSISPQHKIGNLVQAIMTNPTFSEDEKSQLVEDLINEIKEIDVRAGREWKEIELKLTKEIEKVRNEIKDTKFTMLKWQFIFWATQFGAIVTIGFKLLGK